MQQDVSMLIETILSRPYQIQFEHSIAATGSGQSNAILINRYTLTWNNQIDETDPNCSNVETYSQSSEYCMTHMTTLKICKKIKLQKQEA